MACYLEREKKYAERPKTYRRPRTKMANNRAAKSICRQRLLLNHQSHYPGGCQRWKKLKQFRISQIEGCGQMKVPQKVCQSEGKEPDQQKKQQHRPPCAQPLGSPKD